MKKSTIEELAYILRNSKIKNQPKPILFIGAGVSKTGNIPLANEITQFILKEYPTHPRIKRLKSKNPTYYELMECLQPFERDNILKGYIDKAKINVSHIYIAQLIKYGFLDYILTVNFDNLLLRALALFNEFPSTYDMAILNELTTTTFKEKSVVYLHGQHHGLWLLNTEEEMIKVNETIPRIFDSIKNKRPWIFIGYSGNDPIFNHIEKLGRFDNGLYWVSHGYEKPNSKVMNLLKKPNSNSYLIEGFDSDSFMLKLNSLLDIQQPEIIEKPLNALNEMLDNIVDIEDDEHFKGVKERLIISKSQVLKAINEFEKDENNSNLEQDLLKKRIINLIATQNFSQKQIDIIAEEVSKNKDNKSNELFSDLYFNWGSYYIDLSRNSKKEEEEKFLNIAIEKYKKSVEINNNNFVALQSWVDILLHFEKNKKGKEKEEILFSVIEKCKQIIKIFPEDFGAYFYWGQAISKLIVFKNNVEKISSFKLANKKYEKAIKLNSDFYQAYHGWAINIASSTRYNKVRESKNEYEKSFKKFELAFSINPEDTIVLSDWARIIFNLSIITNNLRSSKNLFNKSILKLEQNLKIEENGDETLVLWGMFLASYAILKSPKNKDELFEQSFYKFQLAIKENQNCLEAHYFYSRFLNIYSNITSGAKSLETNLQSFNQFNLFEEKKTDDFHGYYDIWGNYLGVFDEIKEIDFVEKVFLPFTENNKYYFNLSVNFYKHKTYDKAKYFLNKALDKNEVNTKYVLEEGTLKNLI